MNFCAVYSQFGMDMCCYTLGAERSRAARNAAVNVTTGNHNCVRELGKWVPPFDRDPFGGLCFDRKIFDSSCAEMPIWSVQP
jgi:hypothetical protein